MNMRDFKMMKRFVFKDDQKQDVWISVVFALMMLGILVVCLFMPGILYAKKRETIPNILLLPLGLCFVYMLYLVVDRLFRKGNKKGRKGAFLLCSLGVLAIQLFMTYQYYFYTDWDVETIVQCAMATVTGEDVSRHSNYFSMYPNNLVLVTLFGWIVRLAYSLGFAEHAYFALIVFQCIICWLTGILLYMLVYNFLFSDNAAVGAWVLYQLVVGISPWVSIPYSDAVALFFPTAILAVDFLMPKEGKIGIVRLFLLTFLTYFGYRIKPQVMIVTIAICLYKVGTGVLTRRQKAIALPKTGSICGMAAGLLFAVLLANGMADDVKVPRNEDLTFGIAHYLMMGMNPDEFGAYAQRDVSFSWRCATRKERTQKNLEVFWQRVNEMGPVGVFKQLVRKTLTNFNDGTFCWAGEGIFYREILEEKSPLFSPFMRSIYYSNEGRAYPVWANFAQAVWMSVMMLCVCASFGRRNEGLSVVMLSVIGLTIFEMLFEARARYLFCYAPLFILLAVSGLNAIRVWAGKWSGDDNESLI